MTNSLIHNLLHKRVASHSGQDLDTVRKDCDRDNYMTAEQALKYGLIDKVV